MAKSKEWTIQSMYSMCHGIDLSVCVALGQPSLLDWLLRVYVDCPLHVILGMAFRRQARSHPMHTCGYVFVCPCMHRRPPKSPIKGHILLSTVSLWLSSHPHPRTLSHDQHPGQHCGIVPALTTITLRLFILSSFMSLLPHHHSPHHYHHVHLV